MSRVGVVAIGRNEGQRLNRCLISATTQSQAVVYVGAGARILGAISIGDRAQIGANAVVLKDVPADHVAVGVPATIRPAKPAGS